MRQNIVRRAIQRRSRRVATTAWSCVGLGALICSSAGAAETAPDEGTILEEVLVTAQHRIERLQDVPISVQVLGGEALVKQNINSLLEIGSIAPSVHIDLRGRTNLLYIRGVGSGSVTSIDQSAGLFIDDIYHGRSRSTAGTFLDLERVEILKGPQSTFFGNNAIAGAFNIVTKKPGDEFDPWARALYGEDGQYALEGAVGGPISEHFGVRAAITYNGTDGWIYNQNTGESQPNEDNLAGRVTFSLTRSEAFDATLKVEASRNENSGVFFQIDQCPPLAPFTVVGFCQTALNLGIPLGLDNDQNSESAGQKISLDGSEEVLTFNYHGWGEHTLTSVTGYYEYDYEQDFDLDGLPTSGFHAAAPESYHQFSQEFRIASPTGRTIEYLAGAYFQTDHLSSTTDQTFFFLTPTIQGAAPFAGLRPYTPIAQEIAFTQDEESRAVFGAVTWNVTDHLKLTGGLRGTWVDKDFDWTLLYGTATQAFGGVVPLPGAENTLAGGLGLGRPGSLSGLSRSDHDWMPSARIQYVFNPDLMIYASYADGFKAGGFNGNYNAPQGAVASEVTFGPETVDAYELGLKSEWFDRRLHLNLALFRSEFEGLQVSRNVPNASGAQVSIVSNAAQSISQGVELETRWSPTHNFYIAAVASYIDSYYASYRDAPLTGLQAFCRTRLASNSYCAARFPSGIAATQDLSDTQLPLAPEWSGSVTGAYAAALPGDYELTTELNAYYSADYYQDWFDNWGGAYTKVDARLTLEAPGRHWAIDLIGRNLTDETTYSFVSGHPTTPGGQLKQRDQPRNFAAQIRYQW